MSNPTNKEVADVITGLLNIIARSRIDVQGNAIPAVSDLLRTAENVVVNLTTITVEEEPSE